MIASDWCTQTIGHGNPVNLQVPSKHNGAHVSGDTSGMTSYVPHDFGLVSATRQLGSNDLTLAPTRPIEIPVLVHMLITSRQEPDEDAGHTCSGRSSRDLA